MLNSRKFKKVNPFSLKNQSQNLCILHVSTPNSWRGGEQQAYYLIEELEKLGVTQYLICNEKGELKKRAKAKGWNVISCKKTSALDFSFAFQIKHACKSLNVTHIHTHDSQAHTLAFLATVVFRNKTPIVVSRRVDFKVGVSGFSKWKYNHPMVKKIICVSKAIQNMMAPYIKDNSRLCTIHSGIDFTRFKDVKKGTFLRDKYAVPPDHFMIGNTSALAPHKDYYTFVDAAEELLKQEIKAHFFIIGDGSEKNAIAAYIKEKNLQQFVHLTGFIENILPVLKELDLFLMTSKTEGLGTSLLDAFACQIPVVATSAGGIPELIQHRKTGLLASVGNASELAELVKEVLSNNELKSDLTTQAQIHLQSFSKAYTAQKTLGVYKSIVNKY